MEKKDAHRTLSPVFPVSFFIYFRYTFLFLGSLFCPRKVCTLDDCYDPRLFSPPSFTSHYIHVACFPFFLSYLFIIFIIEESASILSLRINAKQHTPTKDDPVFMGD